MIISRRGFLSGLLASAAAPVIAKALPFGPPPAPPVLASAPPAARLSVVIDRPTFAKLWKDVDLIVRQGGSLQDCALVNGTIRIEGDGIFLEDCKIVNRTEPRDAVQIAKGCQGASIFGCTMIGLPEAAAVA